MTTDYYCYYYWQCAGPGSAGCGLCSFSLSWFDSSYRECGANRAAVSCRNNHRLWVFGHYKTVEYWLWSKIKLKTPFSFGHNVHWVDIATVRHGGTWLWRWHARTSHCACVTSVFSLFFSFVFWPNICNRKLSASYSLSISHPRCLLWITHLFGRGESGACVRPHDSRFYDDDNQGIKGNRP